MRANVARHDEYTPIEDILADYIENDSTVSARSLVARLHTAGESPPDPPPSPPDLNYDDSSDEDDDQHGPANDEYQSNAVSPTPPEATEHEPERQYLLFHRHAHFLVALAPLTSIPLGSHTSAAAERALVRSSC